MKTFLIYLPYVISFLIGYFLLHLLFRKEEKLYWPIFITLAFGFGLGLSSIITFLSFVIFNQLNPPFLILSHLILLLILFTQHLIYVFKNKTYLIDQQTLFNNLAPIFLLSLISVPLWYQSHFYAHGGWDAWTVWNLKAKILFLGGENWQNMFDPVLWRSSQFYPLLVPLINVWGWIATGEVTHTTTVLTSFFFTFLSTGLLFFALKDCTKSYFAIVPALVLLTLPIFNKLSLSQYVDNTMGFFLLAIIYCLIQSKKRNSAPFSLMAGIFCGFLSFAKTEGMVAAVLLIGLGIVFFYFRNKEQINREIIFALLLGAFIAFIPTIYFNVVYAPENQTFINGLTSLQRPASFYRLKVIFAFYFLELFYWKSNWNGIWFVLCLGLLFSGRRSLNSKIIIFPAFFLIYFMITTFYYYLNTYFKIDWWLQVTLHRIIFALLPAVFFWVFYSLWETDDVGVR